MASFSKAFAAARRRLGPGQTFIWNGRPYSTNYAEEKGSATRPKQRPATLTSPRPRARPDAETVETNLGAETADVDIQSIPVGRAAAAAYGNPDIALAAARAAEDADRAPGSSPRPRSRRRLPATDEEIAAARARRDDALLDEYKSENRFRQRYDEAVEYIENGRLRRGR